MRLDDAQRLDWLRLIRCEGVGPRTFRALVNRFGGAGPALDALPELARSCGRRIRVATRAEAEREFAAASRLGVRFVALGEPDYPAALRATDGAPPLLAVRGAPAVLARPAVAIVGSRNASANGGAFTERLARGLGAEGFVVVSGLARGIDARAHRAAIPTGTVAVLAGGHERVYPPENGPLLDALIEAGGAAVTEMPLAWEPRARDFPRRNRIVSGLALGVVVVEAARRSGSLITARLAAEQGREVFAVPGSPLDPRAEGTNDLIREGATLCASAEHVASALAPLVAGGGRFPPGLSDAAGLGGIPERGKASGLGDDAFGDELFLDDEPVPAEMPEEAPEPQAAPEPQERDPATLLARIMGPAPVSADELVRQSGLSARAVRAGLLELELAGRIERHGGDAVSLLR